MGQAHRGPLTIGGGGWYWIGCFPIGGANLFKAASVLLGACVLEGGTGAAVAGDASTAAFAVALEALVFFFDFRLLPVLFWPAAVSLSLVVESPGVL